MVAVEWNPIHTHMISCTTHDGTVLIFDTRKFTNHTTGTANINTAGTAPTTALVRKIQFPFNDRIESCIFDPLTGKYIIAGVTNRSTAAHPPPQPSTNSTESSNNMASGMGYMKVCQWDSCKSNIDNTDKNQESNTQQQVQPQDPQQWYSYPAHAGPIYTIATTGTHSHRGRNRSSATMVHKIATGGSDAVVGIWDVSSMTCTSTVASRTKFIRALAFSYPNHDTDPLLLAIATEEDGIELIDCTTDDGSGNSIGYANFSNSTNTGRRSMMMSSSGSTAGAEDISFHPTIPNLLACARTTDSATSSGMSSVTLLKFNISSNA